MKKKPSLHEINTQSPKPVVQIKPVVNLDIVKQELIKELIEIGELIEANHYNQKFGLYSSKDNKNLKAKAQRRIAKLKTLDVDVNVVAETNEDLEYALQFI